MNIHYALQTCDVASNQTNIRICNTDKNQVTKKCVSSFFQSVKKAACRSSNIMHNIMIFDDHSTDDTIEFLNRCIKTYSHDNVRIKLTRLRNTGIMQSIEECYRHLIENGTDLVYQVQDDYLFESDAVSELIDTFFRIYHETQSEPIITPYNAPYLWAHYYRNVTAPRTVFIGKSRYWIQIYDISCSFLTSHTVLKQNYDILAEFLSLDPKNPELEKLSLNKMLVNRGYLAVCPFESIALHIQGEYERDPYVDWKPIWNRISADDIG